MNILLQLFQIIMLQRRPQDIDYNESAAGFILIALIALQYFGFTLIEQLSKPLIYSAAITISQAALLFLALLLASKANRFIQTSTAFFGIYLIFILSIVGFVLLRPLTVLLPFWFIWYFFISLLVIKESFSTSWFPAVALVLGINFAQGMVMSLLFPEFNLELSEFLELLQARLEQ